jgi:hypothetical protein
MTAPIAPSWTWGSSTRVLSVDNTISPSQQLASISLPEPAVCTLYFQCSVTKASVDAGAAIRAFTLNLLEGIGRVTIPRQITFDAQPAIDAPIEFTLPFVPLHALQVNVQQICQLIVTDPIETECYLVLSPLTRVPAPVAQGAMKFGMSLPGEADSLDDELLGELETESPTVAEVMAFDATGTPGEIEEPEVPDESRIIVRRIIARLTERLGRPPTREEASAAVKRVQDRMVRRSLRGRP